MTDRPKKPILTDPREQVEILRRALAWYANPDNWQSDDWGVKSVIASPDYGKPGMKARNALKRAGLEAP